MYYSLTFLPFKDSATPKPPYNLDTDRNTWEHWRIVPTSRPVFAAPSPKTNYVEVPGANGKLDLSQVLTGYPLYSNRTGSIEFVVMNDFRHWQQAYTDIMTTVHNRKLYCVYEEDPEYYYVGRWSVQNWTSAEGHSKITLSYDLEPFKWRLYDSDDSWLWDPFNFKTGVVTSRLSNFGSVFNSSVSVNNTTEKLLDLATNETSSIIWGDVTEDNTGVGYLDMMNNFCEVLGSAPIVPKFTVSKRLGQETDPSIHIQYHNPELQAPYRDVPLNINAPVENVEFPNIILTNYTGVNKPTLTVTGDGVVSWVYRPGRF